MSNCSNCYNGCTEIVSDRCVKYTGIDVPVLGIQTGDSLSFVEQALITFLTSTLDGTGVKIDLGTTVVCNVVNKYLPTCKDLSIVDISIALIEAACDLQAQIDAIDADLAILNADYTIGCLTGVTASSDTHAIVQAVINKLCQVQVDLTALTLEVHNQYVPINSSPGHPGVNDYIAAYLSGSSGASKYYNKMIPFAVVEYYGPIAGNFDSTGAGVPTGPWEKIYLCNGNNGTPDKRGRVGVGTTDGSMLGLTLPADTNPGSSPFNPTYTLGGVAGSNSVVLLSTQIPSHTHTATAVSTDAGHMHIYGSFISTQNGDQSVPGGSTPYYTPLTGTTSTSYANITTTVTVNPFGGNLPHANNQPALGCYYIQYRP
jgi:microcystin-dependent protein